MLKRLGIEALWFVPSLGLGMFVFVALAFHHDEVTDTYWTAHGFPPPLDYAFSPARFMWFFMLGPWMLLLGVRVLVWALRRLPRYLSAA